MALIRFSDGTSRECTPELGARIWDILNGTTVPNDKEARVVEKIEKLWLNWQTAPDSYIKANFNTIAKMVVGQWMVDAQYSENEYGKKLAKEPMRRTLPDPANTVNIAFSEKWGLLKGGRITALGRRMM